MKLWSHQQRFIDRNPDRALLLWEVGCGKSLAACEWIKLRPNRKALVIAPKAIQDKWREDLKESGTIARVIKTDDVKIIDLSPYDCIVVDESHNFHSPLFTKERSKRAEKLYTHIKDHPNTHVLLLSATPVRSTYWNIHTAACYLGIFWPLREFRNEFEYLTSMYGRMHYEPVKDWRVRVRKYVEEISDIVLLRDCVDVPAQHTQVIEIPWTAKQENDIGQMYLPVAEEWHERHRRENSIEKLAVLKEVLSGYRKVVVVCYYTEQIAEYAAEIGKERQVFILQGSTKNQGTVISEAQDTDDCVFFVQSDMGLGFDLDSFSTMVFASTGFSYVSMVQMKGRVLRIHNLHENTYYHLIGGKADKAVFSQHEKGKDFNPHEYLRTRKGSIRSEDW